MKLTVKNNGQILKDSPEIELSDFVVLTGENGSGKTQLLRWIENSVYMPTGEEDIKIGLYDIENPVTQVIYADPGLVVQEMTDGDIMISIQTQWKDLQHIVQAYFNIEDREFSDSNTEVMYLNQALTNLLNSLNDSGSNQHSYKQVTKVQKHHVDIVKSLAKKTGKEKSRIKFADFLMFYEIPNALFSPALNLLFHQFHLKSKYYPELVEGITPPWEIFNQILDNEKFKYRALYKESENEMVPLPVKLVDTEHGHEVHFEELSSGEKTIMSLIFTLYNRHKGGLFPDVLLLDEPDALLHPSMTKLFLDVVQQVIVEQNKVKVIITTHSPSTVALSPDLSIYVMDRAKGYPVKSERKPAIRSLINGLTNINVLYEHKKQVFVEAKMDEDFYTEVYSLLSNKRDKDIYLTFLAVGNNEGGGCDKVKEYTNKLSSNGNNYICGVIDWDSANVGSERVKVLGLGNRYNIENYIFDPLYVSLYLFKFKLEDQVKLGYSKEDVYHNVLKFNIEKLQRLVDGIVGLVKSKLDVKFQKEGFTTCILNCGHELNIPKWYLECPGHELERIIVESIPQFKKQEYKQKNALKKAIIKNIVLEFPEFISNDLNELFISIEKIKV